MTTAPTHKNQPPTTISGMHGTGLTAPLRRVRQRLRTVRRTGRALLAVIAVSRFFSIGLLGTAALVLLDYVARFPAPVRVFFLLGLIIAVCVGYAKLIRPVTRYRPPLPDVAARVERWLAARDTPTNTVLSGGVGIRYDDSDDWLTRALARLAGAELAGLMPRVPWGMMRWRPTALALAALIVLATGAAVLVNVAPAMATTGLARLYAPWTGAEWPRLTSIADATPDGVHPSDTPLPIRATLLRSNRAEGESRIAATYRVIGQDGSLGEPTGIILVPQPAASARSSGAAGELYERLIDPARWRSPAHDEAADRFFEYTINSEDDSTSTKRIRIVAPPVLTEASLGVSLPEYARRLLSEQAKHPTGDYAGSQPGSPTEAQWLSGARTIATSESAAGPVLAGSNVTLRLRYSKPVSPGNATIPENASLAAEGDTIEIALAPRQTAGLELLATGEDGFSTREPFRLRLAVVADRAPTATIMEPSGTRAVLPTAVLPLAARGEDDLSIAEFRVVYIRAVPDPNSLSGEVIPQGEPTVLLDHETSSFADINDANAMKVVTLRGDLDIAATGSVPGDEIWITAIATDTYELDGESHEPVRSPTRRIRIIEESRFIEMLQDELEGVRRTAISLDERQGEIMRDGETLEADPESTDATRDDDAARALVDTAPRLAKTAGREAEHAAGQTAERASGMTQADPSEAQQGVREALAEMINRLDRGRDDWVVRRAIERLAETQRELLNETAQAGEQTVGRELDELSPDERTALERIADRQRELAEQAQQAIDDLADRAGELRESDPTQAAALEQAARDARRSELAEAISQAAEQVARNQTGAATGLQQQSIEDLESILEGLENAQRLRVQALRRELASLIQSIQSLIRQQNGVIAAIEADAEADPANASLMAERVRTNTLAAAASAGGFDEVGPVIDLLNRAADAQLDAVRTLRARPAEADPARAASAKALARLEEALAEAQRQDENAAQRERDQQRRELVDAYRAALESQSSLRDRTAAIDPGNLTRRDRAELRTIGRDQESLRVEIATIPEANELPPGGITDLYHERIDAAITSAVRRLGRGQTDAGVRASQDSTISMLRAIVDVLSPDDPQQDPFDDQQSAGGGGGGGSGGQDQPAIGQLEELRLLRSLQGLLLDETRAADAAGRADSPDLASMQTRIAEQARRIIESMKGGGPNSPPIPAGSSASDGDESATPPGPADTETGDPDTPTEGDDE